jgi:hypothetical protein
LPRHSQLNTTEFEKTERLTLQGIGPDGSGTCCARSCAAAEFLPRTGRPGRIRLPGTDTAYSVFRRLFPEHQSERFELLCTELVRHWRLQLTYSSATGLIIIETGSGRGPQSASPTKKAMLRRH